MSVFSFSPGSQFLGGQFLGAQSNEVARGNIAFENFLKENLNNTVKKSGVTYAVVVDSGRNTRKTGNGLDWRRPDLILTLFLVSFRLNIKLRYLFLYLLSVSLYI